MAQNKTRPTDQSVAEYLNTLTQQRNAEANVLIEIMRAIAKQEPVLWGPSIIGFGSKHYKYDTGREGDIPRISFSPRKSVLTVYFSEGFDRYAAALAKLGKYKASVSCLYISKLSDIDIKVLQTMLQESYIVNDDTLGAPVTVDDYINRVPLAAQSMFNELRGIVKRVLPHAEEVLSYGIVGYKIDDKRARVFISGWKDHVALYPIPKNEELQHKLKPYIKGKGTLWFSLEKPLPKDILEQTIRMLAD